MDGFLQNIGWLCKKYETAHRDLRIVRRTRITEQEIQNPLVKPAILGVIREAFDNATRHSGADRVHLWLGLWGDHVRVVIEDNGVGFDPEPALLAGEGRGCCGSLPPRRAAAEGSAARARCLSTVFPGMRV